MYIATNRQLNEEKKGLKKFGSVPSESGPNELRLTEVTVNGNSVEVQIREDKLKIEEVEEINNTYDLGLDTDQTWYASLKVAVELLHEAEQRKKQILFFVHGYNNDLKDIVSVAGQLESQYNVLCVVFSWPSNGGGAVSGTLAYLSDKDDARISATAFNRFVDKIRYYNELISSSREEAWLAKAKKKHPDNLQKAQEMVTRLIEDKCHVSLNLICHSMGNYLLKYALMPGNTAFGRLTFDNVCMVAADANNPLHEIWVDKIEFRNRLYIVINENDYALAWSRRKPGQEQKVRLGHSLDGLVSRNAKYINVTNANWVRKSHSYFLGEPVEENLQLNNLFACLFEGRTAEEEPAVGLAYRADRNAYEI